MTEEAKQATGSYMDDMKARKEASNQKSLEKIEADRSEMAGSQRFGYFSIPYPSTCGDQAYSQNKQFQNHQIIDGKVITEKRGIFTNPGKKGKGRDVYFQEVEPLPQEQVDKYKQDTINKRQKYLDDLKLKREKKEIKFKPGGPQEVTGYYNSEDRGQPSDGPIYKVKNKFRFIKEGKVVTENRGIFTNPTKLGTSLFPSDYFGFYSNDDAINEMIKKKAQEEDEQRKKLIEFRKDKNNYSRPFIPASLKKCDCFASNSETFGIEPEYFNNGLQNFREYKKNGRPKYVHTLPSGCVEHPRPFAPPKLISTGRSTLFNDDLYTLPNLPEEKKMSLQERLELEKKNKKETFRYNRLMNHSNFSPSVSSFKCNLRNEFRGLKF